MAQDNAIYELNSPTRGSRRVISLRQMKDRPPVDNAGMIDKRLFSGENNLLALKDPVYDLWYIRYEHGTIPEELRQSFTSFTMLFKYARAFFNKRNIEISEV